jgi:N-acetylneuraminate synthase/sialic acid synthase
MTAWPPSARENAAVSRGTSLAKAWGPRGDTVAKLKIGTGGARSRIAEIAAERAYVVAEIGQNHQGDPAIARELVRRAAECGADAVKSQKRHLDTLLTPEERSRPYDSPHSFGRTYGEHRVALELSADTHARLAELARTLGLDYFCSPWDVESARELRAAGLPYMKIPSAALTHDALLAEVAGYGMPVLLSTGMSTLAEVDGAVSTLSACELYVLQCTSAYPCEFTDVHLRVIPELRARYGRVVGFSGHHRGISADIAAVALGARVLERHFTLDRTWKGSDHAASLEPQGLSRLVRDVRAVEAALGSSVKALQACEVNARQKLRTAALRKVA